MVDIEGRLENIIYYNKDNGYCVFSLLPEDDNSRKIVCIAYMSGVNTGETLKLSGEYIVHPTYGRQLKVSTYRVVLPASAENIEKYLASGIVKGIGKKLAKKIVDMFGDNTLEVIEKTPERLSKIKGITLTKAIAIGEIMQQHTESRRTILYLQELGVPPGYAMKIHKKYGYDTISIIKTNPYKLVEGIFGIGFKIADSIAFKVGIAKEDVYRVGSGVRYVLTQGANSGHTYLPRDMFLEEAQKLLQIPEEIIENVILDKSLNSRVWIEKKPEETRIFSNRYYYAEYITGKKMIELSEYSVSTKVDLKKYEVENDISFAEHQKLAVMAAMEQGVLVITGGPGTGKTTIIKAIISLLLEREVVVELAAPTGKAAKRMSETTGIEAKTIHRMLGINFIPDSNRQVFSKNEDTPIDADVVIVDESSMIDIMLMQHLLEAIQPPTRLILLGDVDQLPSVGAGNVLKDIIDSKCIATVRLTEIFRQAQKSAIVTNAHKVNKGELPKLEDNEDFFFMKRGNIDSVVDTLIELVTTRLPAYKNYNSLKDIQILTPMRKSTLGSIELNKVLQKVLNPPDDNKKEKEFRETTFREGDKVMQIRNNYSIVWEEYDRNGKQIGEGTGVFNGDEGIIVEIDDDSEIVSVVYDGCKLVEYDYSQLEEIELSYAITVHKSQGCEYKATIVLVHSGPPMLMSRNLLYTAITRSKELAVLVGTENTIHRMVSNDKGINRYSSLDEQLVKWQRFFKN